MKRLVIRLVALSLLVVLGMFAIAQAQRQFADEDGDSQRSVVVSRFSDADENATAADDDLPRDPTGRRALGVDPRVHVMRDDQAEPAIYRGQPNTGVVPAAHDDEQPTTVVAGDDPRPLAAAPPTRRYGDVPPAAAANEIPDAEPDSANPGLQRRYGSLDAGDKSAAEPSPAAAGAANSRLQSARDAANAIDAEVAAAVRGDGPAAPPAIAKGADIPAATPRVAPTRPLADRSTDTLPVEVPAPRTPASRQVESGALESGTAGTVAAPSGTVGTGTVGTGTPGSRELEGLQTPSLSIEKVVPAEVQVGKTAVFEIRIQNTGRNVARELQVVDQVPQGARLVNTEPRAELGPRGELLWNLAALDPGATAVVRVELAPLVEGQIGSVARVRFAADASARTTVTKPQIAIDVTAPETVMIGEEALLAITVSNPGSGEATGVILEADIPAGLKHPAGTELEFEVGTLRPNESRRLELTVTAARQGPAAPTLIARAAGVPAAEQMQPLEVVAPKLQLGLEGPRRRFLDRKSTHVLTVSNPGTAAAVDVELVAYLPRGMKFVEANNHGAYDAQQHAVYWSLAELPPQRSGDVQLVTLPTESGEQLLRVEGKATRGLADECEETISVEGVTALSFQITDLADPLAVGDQASYEVRVINTGSKSASNVQVVAVLPAEMVAIDATGPTASKRAGGKIVFDPITRLAPKEEQVFQFRAEAAKAGDLRVRVQLTSDEIQQPITQEESTRVFSDE